MRVRCAWNKKPATTNNNNNQFFSYIIQFFSMKFQILFSLFFAFSVIGLSAQTSTGGAFEFSEQGTYDPKVGATQGEPLTVFGQTLPTYITSKGKRVAHVRGNYYVYSDFVAIDQLPDGTEVYLSPSGTPFIWAQGAKGVYAKYGKRK